jgi:peptide/nickel transport system substrate-binding protein
MIRRLWSGAVVVLLLSACAPSTSTATPSASGVVLGGTLRVGVPESFTGFGPYDKRSRIDYLAIVNIFDRLVTYDSHYVPIGQLATGWTNPDDTTWDFKLRTGVTFHDGTAFNADAAAFSLERLRASPFGKQVSRITTITVKDPTMLEIKVSRPFPTLPAVLSQPFAAIVSPTAYQKLGAAAFAKTPVASGPFKFVSWNPSAELVLTANASYWQTDEAGTHYPYLSGVVFKILPDVAAAALALQHGDVDLISKVSLPSIRQLASGGKTKILETPTLGWNYIFLNTKSKPFDDVHRRRAFQYAVDRQAIVDAVVFGHGVPMLGPIPSNSWAYDPAITTSGLYSSKANIDKAKSELAAASPPGGFQFTLTYPNDEPFTGVAQAVKAQLAAVGIVANLDGREIGSVLDDMFASKFQALNIDWSGRIDEDLSSAAFYETDGPNNFGKYENPEVDRVLRDAGTTSDRQRRTSLYHQAQTLINQDAPIILIFFPTDAKGLRSNVGGFKNLGDERLYLYNVWLGK